MKIIKNIIDIIEVYLPSLTFFLMFICFVIQIVSRYFFNLPTIWTMEVSLIMFLWTTLIGACYALREKSHVEFTALYDLYPAKIQFLCRVTGNILIIFALGYALLPNVEFIDFMSFQKTTALKINFSLIYSSYIIFSIIVITRLLISTFKDFKMTYKRDEKCQ
ncbi:TRAP transporter small permease [Vibrio sp. MA40-2]|uniref:TRAP transporter small permease n=1 Tax=Vibrio sp. MA40-2 TaxID=3391828 RepID=UPI0039A6F117